MAQCSAKAKRSGIQCLRPAMHGGFVCQKHGGMAPQVRAKAAERLLADRAVMEFGLERARDPERVIAEIGCIAFSSLADLYDEQGGFRAFKDLPAHLQVAIGGSETVTGNVDKGDGQSDRLVRTKLWDKPKMLEMLAKHHGLVAEHVNLTVSLVADRLHEGRKRLSASNG